jgi:2-polyprenyl-3-methyl-5-hydroxy-6-metoxy-1,4-benzoquinol methylase
MDRMCVKLKYPEKSVIRLMKTITPGELVAYLKSISPNGMRFMDKLKVNYRPLICPLHELLNIVTAGKKVFDIGCGNGSFLALVARFCEPVSLGGIEINEKLVKNARAILDNTAAGVHHDVQWYNGSEVPGLDTYDYVFMTDVFHHIPVEIRQSVLQQVYQKMKPGAVFIMKDIDAAKFPWVYFNKLHDAVAAGEIGHEVSAETMKTMLTACGFSISSRSYRRMLWYPHYTFVCSKT